ncbi:MAG: glycosyltransferase family 4 protein [Ktedonobacteraceae bacterium]|nr:glycosyltransferase family 4 protein [Ktedonobacteraceae bacterium]
MRILMLAQFYHPILGGIEQHVRTLSHELVARGHDVSVATMRHKDQAAFEMDQGVRIHRVRSSVQRLPWLFSNSGRQYPPPFPDPEIMLDLHHVLEKERPEIVHAHNWLVRSFLPLKTRSKARLVVTLHDYNYVCARVDLMHYGNPCSGPGIAKCLSCASNHYGPVRGVPTVLSNWAMNLFVHGTVDRFIAVSQSVATGNRLASSRVPFLVIPNFMADDPGLAEGDVAPYLAQLPTEEFLLFVGGLSRVKGVEVLLRAYAGLRNAPPLVLIGYPTPDWPFPGLKNLENVIVLKDWPHYAVMAAWERCTLALIPSIWRDPCPTVAMEAMYMSRPVIASRIGGLIDIVVDGETGLLVSPDDPQALQDAIQGLLEDPSRQEYMGTMAKRRVEMFQAHTVVPRIEQVYHEVVNTNAVETVEARKILSNVNARRG